MCTGRLPARVAVLLPTRVPGNGLAAVQRANAQSVDGMVGPGVTMPLYVSFVCVVSVAWVVSSVSGRYGIGLPMTLSGCEATPERLMMRPSTLPVTSDPSPFFAIGTATQWLVPVAW